MNVFKNRKGQGTTEYIVILAVVVAALVIFWPRIKDALSVRVTETTRGISSVR
jgi:hypothetical protein